MQESQEVLARRASLTAGIIGAAMVVIVCFGIAFALTFSATTFSNPAGAKTSDNMQAATVQADNA